MGSQILKSWGFKLYFGGIEHTWKILKIDFGQFGVFHSMPGMVGVWIGVGEKDQKWFGDLVAELPKPEKNEKHRLVVGGHFPQVEKAYPGYRMISRDIYEMQKKKLHALIDAVVFFKNFKFPPDVLWQFPPNLELTGRELPQKAACWILWRQRRLPSCPNQEPPPATTGPAPSFRRVAKGVKKDLRTRDRRNPKRWLWL